MTAVYCGIGKIPKGHRRASLRECAEKGQIRYYGIKKIDPKSIYLSKQKDVIPESREKLLTKMTALRGTIRRNKGRYEGSKDKTAKEEYYKVWQAAEKDLVKVLAKLRKIEAARDVAKKAAAKEKTKSKSKSISKTKPKPKAKPKSTSKSTSKSQSKPKSTSKSQAKPKSTSKSQSKSKSKSKSKNMSRSTRARARSKSKSKRRTRARKTRSRSKSKRRTRKA